MITERQMPLEERIAPRQKGIAVLGCGYWGVNYLRVINELTGSRVVAACDIREQRLSELARRWPNTTLTTSVDEVLALPDVEAVVICTEATSHYAVAKRCLEAGVHVLIEKPMTTTVPHAQELVQLADDRGLVLMVGHVFLFNSGVRKVKEYISQGKAGQLYYLYARRTNLGPIRRDVNALWDLAAHDIAIFNYLLDSSPIWVSAVGSKVLRNGREDVGFISIGYPHGVIGHIHVSWADPSKVREVVVVGSDMRIVFDDVNTAEQVRVYEKGVAPTTPDMSSFGEYHFQIRDGDIISPHIEISEPLKNQCSHFIECIETGSRPLTCGREGLEVVEVMTAVDQSIAQNGMPITVMHGTVHGGNNAR
jgi:predicted dehydrogenase